MNKIIGTIKDVGDSEVVNKVYDDVFQPTTRFIGTTVYRAVKVAFAPVRGLIWSAEQIEEWIYTKVSAHLEHVPEENIITPDPLIAVPLIQQVRISGNHEHLKELYAKLLAKSMDKTQADKILPSYVDIIKQLSVLDVQLLELLRSANRHRLPLAELRITYDTGYNPFLENLTLLSIANAKNIAIAIDNLSRLRLIDIPWDAHILPESIYDDFKNTNQYKQCQTIVNVTPNAKSVEIHKKQFKLTEFGLDFISLCK